MKLKENVQSKVAVLKQLSWLQISFFAATAILGILYIWQVNVAATRGFAMRELDRDIAEFQLENERLQMDVARLQSIDSVSSRIKMLGLTEVNRIEYLSPEEGVVAINR